MTGYTEQTRVNPRDGAEVYGADGYGWYTDRDTATEHFPRTTQIPSKNSLFVYLDGMTAEKLGRKGFIL